jgi:hypothetical protein
MYYREIHLDSSSDARTKGTSNHPVFHLQDPLYVTQYSVKNVTLPFSFSNIHTVSQFTWNLVDAERTPLEIPIIVPPNYYNLEVLSQHLLVQYNLGIAESDYEERVMLTAEVQPNGQIRFTFGETEDEELIIDIWIFNTSQESGGRDTILQKLLGYGTNPLSEPNLQENAGIPNTRDTLPCSFTLPNFLMLRSNFTRGASYISNMQGAYVLNNNGNLGNHTSVNILAKVPIDANNSPQGATGTISINENPSPNNMFSFDGEYIDSFDLYFTYPNEDKEVDFLDQNFSVTLSILSTRKP